MDIKIDISEEDIEIEIDKIENKKHYPNIYYNIKINQFVESYLLTDQIFLSLSTKSLLELKNKLNKIKGIK